MGRTNEARAWPLKMSSKHLPSQNNKLVVNDAAKKFKLMHEYVTFEEMMFQTLFKNLQEQQKIYRPFRADILAGSYALDDIKGGDFRLKKWQKYL